MINDKQTYQDLDLCGFSFARYHRKVFHLPACLPGAGRRHVRVFEVGRGGLGVHQHGGCQVTGTSVIEFLAIEMKIFAIAPTQ